MVSASGKHHRPVLLATSLAGLRIVPDGFYIDATYGRGGHSREILKLLGRRGKLLAFDKDPDACAHAREHFSCDPRFRIFQGSFTRIARLQEEGMTASVAGILFDLGVSSPQLETAERGFSFLRDGPLDMRMDNTAGVSASQWLGSASAKEIESVLREYGEEPRARKIARRISSGPLPRTTLELAALVGGASGGAWQPKNPATRTFLAIRLYLNKELEELSEALAAATELLRLHGRLVVISFHSLEDRIVKKFIHGRSTPRCSILTGQPLPGGEPMLCKVGRPVHADGDETAENPRARSALLRVAEKL